MRIDAILIRNNRKLHVAKNIRLCSISGNLEQMTNLNST